MHRPVQRSYQPTTFLERGASVPFTTPMLADARVRPAARCGLELIVPNPSGGRGSYVLPWTEIRTLCRPTVHDMQLIEHVAALRSLTPATIRNAAKSVACQGLAGRAAGAAAQAALAAERESLIVTNFELLLRLVQQEEEPGTELPSGLDRADDLERRAKRVIARIAPRLGADHAAIAFGLEQLAALYEPIGLGPREVPARLPHAIATLKLLQIEAAALPPGADDQTPVLLEMLVSTAGMTLSLAEQALSEARAQAGQVTGLLAAWHSDAAGLGRLLARADWLMDGWDRICRLWSLDPRDAARREMLEEIASLLPIIPHEVGNWVGFHVEVQAVVHLRRMVLAYQDWRTGLCVHDVIARNEALLAA